eukprot:13210-Heterococcus_DN1.PRE.2
MGINPDDFELGPEVRAHMKLLSNAYCSNGRKIIISIDRLDLCKNMHTAVQLRQYVRDHALSYARCDEPSQLCALCDQSALSVVRHACAYCCFESHSLITHLHLTITLRNIDRAYH